MAGPESAANLRRITPDNLRNQARRLIRASITTGDVRAGEIYPVSYFSTQLGVSGTPVRDALFDLAHEGLVEVIRNRGFRVVTVSQHDLDQIYECRLLLEVPAAGKVAGRMSADQLTRARRYADVAEKCGVERDIVGSLEGDRLFHLCLLEATNNPRLIDIVLRLRAQSRLKSLKLPENSELMATAREHHELLDVIERGDVTETERLMQQHLEHCRRVWEGWQTTADEAH
jgi:DNA-binding GntR family transcriptional regulator